MHGELGHGIRGQARKHLEAGTAGGKDYAAMGPETLHLRSGVLEGDVLCERPEKLVH